MHDPASELPRIPIPRTPVNKPPAMRCASLSGIMFIAQKAGEGGDVTTTDC
jgi:hypothetical protein